MKHIISYCDNDNYNKLDCPEIKDNSIITCSDCKTTEGFWSYKNNRKLWIPNCDCPNLNKANICTLNKKLLPISTYGIDFCQDDNNLELLKKFINKDNVEFYYGCHNYISNCLDTDILGIYQNKIIKIPFLLWDKYHLDLITKLNTEDKIIDCRENPYSCYDKFFYTNPNDSIIDLSPQCFYQIPVKNGTSFLSKKINNTNIRGIKCSHCRLFNGLCFTPKYIYLFSNSLVYKYHKNFKPLNVPGIEINKIFKGIPNKIHGVFYWNKFNSLIFFRGIHYYRYCLKRSILLFKKKISDTWIGVPDSPEGAILMNNDLYFFKKGNYYRVELYSYLKLYKDYYLVFNDKNYGIIDNSNNVPILTQKFNGNIISIDTLLKYKNKLKVTKYSGWIYGSNYTYLIQYNKPNHNKLYKCLKNECRNKGGVYLKIKNNKRIDPGKVCDFGKICKLFTDLPQFIDFISICNSDIWIGLESNLYKYNLGTRKFLNKDKITNIFDKIKIPKEIKTIDLCSIKKEKITNYQTLKHINNDINQTLVSNNKINQNLVKNINNQAIKEINENNNITILKNDFMTKQRFLEQQKDESDKIDTRNNYLRLFSMSCIILLIIILVKIKYF